MLVPVRTVAPTVALLTPAEVRDNGRIDASDEDVLLASLIEAATTRLEGRSGILGRALLTQTWVQDFETFADPMRLPIGNLISLSSVTYYDSTNAQQTLASSVYGAYTDAIGPYIALKYNQTWPSTYTRPDAIRVTWTAGYGATAADVPQVIRQAALLMVEHWYENRAASSEKQKFEIPFGATALLAPFSRVGI